MTSCTLSQNKGTWCFKTNWSKPWWVYFPSGLLGVVEHQCVHSFVRAGYSSDATEISSSPLSNPVKSSWREEAMLTAGCSAVPVATCLSPTLSHNHLQSLWSTTHWVLTGCRPFCLWSLWGITYTKMQEFLIFLIKIKHKIDFELSSYKLEKQFIYWFPSAGRSKFCWNVKPDPAPRSLQIWGC